MIEGNPDRLADMINKEEKKAKDGISRHYHGRQKAYIASVAKKKKQKKAILKQYYSSILKNAEAYLRKEYEYERHYEEYKLIFGAFNKEWERFEHSVSRNPKKYVKFALSRFSEMAGKPNAALAGKRFIPHLHKKISAKTSRNAMELKLYKGSLYADFSLPFIRGLLMPIYVGRVVGEK